jgi:hypothetical protein
MTIDERLVQIQETIEEACEKGWTKQYTRLFAQHEELTWIGARDGYDKECPREYQSLMA